ncbi:MAG: YiiX/YebB-like N1pC/P60 family cysteine hydrolase [Hyphomicrobium sp.]
MILRSAKYLAIALAIMAIPAGVQAFTSKSKPSTGSQGAPSTPESWPMELETFLKGNYLDRADVVLTRRNWDLSSTVIRWATNSPFSHAALVFNRPGQEPGITNTFVIEAGTSGVDLTNLRDYANDKSSFIAIKRFKGKWFDEPKQARVRGVMLDKIKASYNFWAIGRIARTLWFGVQNKMAKETETKSQRETTLEKYKDKDWTPPSEFICSGFVQIGFVEAVLEYIKEGQLPPSALSDVVFHRGAQRWLPDQKGWDTLGEGGKDAANYFEQQNYQALESVTPDDLAKSRKLEWLYLIRDGKVHQVRTFAEVMFLIGQ